MRNALLIVALILLTAHIYGQTPKYSNEFLSIGVGAKAFGMSNVMVADVDDITAGYWNPAGIASIKDDRQLALMHAEYFAGIAKYDYGALAFNTGKESALSFSMIRFGVDNIPNTTQLIDNEGNIDYDRVTSFSAVDYGFIFSYARMHKSIKNLQYGLSAKIVHRKAGDFVKAWGFGFDAGIQYKYKKWNFGVMGRDITTTFNAWSFNLSDQMKEVWTMTGNVIPENSTEITLPKLILGASRAFDIINKLMIKPAIDLDCTFDGKRNTLVKSDPLSIDPHMGFELGYDGIAFLRGGVGNFQEETVGKNKKQTTFQPNMGVGINIKNTVTIDYALTDLGNSSIALYSNIFSLKINLNKRQQ